MAPPHLFAFRAEHSCVYPGTGERERGQARLHSPQSQFRELVHQHQSRVYSLAYRVLLDSGAAEEIAQDVFLELHRQLDRLESPEHVVAWLRRVTLHRATDALRRRVRRPEYAAEEYQDELTLPQKDSESPLASR